MGCTHTLRSTYRRPGPTQRRRRREWPMSSERPLLNDLAPINSVIRHPKEISQDVEKPAACLRGLCCTRYNRPRNQQRCQEQRKISPRFVHCESSTSPQRSFKGTGALRVRVHTASGASCLAQACWIENSDAKDIREIGSLYPRCTMLGGLSGPTVKWSIAGAFPSVVSTAPHCLSQCCPFAWPLALWPLARPAPPLHLQGWAAVQPGPSA